MDRRHESSSRMNRRGATESSVPPMGFQFDNARKGTIRLAKEQSDQSLDQQRREEINSLMNQLMGEHGCAIREDETSVGGRTKKGRRIHQPIPIHE